MRTWTHDKIGPGDINFVYFEALNWPDPMFTLTYQAVLMM